MLLYYEKLIGAWSFFLENQRRTYLSRELISGDRYGIEV
ncbi:unnamed protein product [Brugia timori]|uniref:Uncharacterized protein n=1 Tax=Brugia timori TaxID=42155 RepID=A0A0R3R6G6_9BILA|nr:unnamed protein product [Brugia timori]